MNLFQWVHRKFRRNGIEPFTDFTFGNPCTCLTTQPTLDDQCSNIKPSLNSINQSRFSKSCQRKCQASYPEFGDEGDEEKSQEEKPIVISDLFKGFLTIGTLGAETVTNEPATPTFAMPLENTSERNAELTENDLKLISYELEKFLEAENKEERFYESSGRNSHVSIIALSGKQLDEAEDEDCGNTAVLPLQGYLFGSSIELPEPITEVRKEKASLGELFLRTKMTNQDITEKGKSRVTGETQVKHTDNSAMNVMRKMLKKVQASSRRCATSGGDPTDSTSTSKKFRKVLRVFHRKVHPENSKSSAGFIKSQKCKVKNVSHDHSHGHDTGDPRKRDKSSRRLPSESKSRKWSQHCKTKWNPPQPGYNCSSSGVNGELWIKTDSESFNGVPVELGITYSEEKCFVMPLPSYISYISQTTWCWSCSN